MNAIKPIAFTIRLVCMCLEETTCELSFSSTHFTHLTLFFKYEMPALLPSLIVLVLR